MSDRFEWLIYHVGLLELIHRVSKRVECRFKGSKIKTIVQCFFGLSFIFVIRTDSTSVNSSRFCEIASSSRKKKLIFTLLHHIKLQLFISTHTLCRHKWLQKYVDGELDRESQYLRVFTLVDLAQIDALKVDVQSRLPSARTNKQNLFSKNRHWTATSNHCH